MSNNKEDRSDVSNPITGAIAFGLGGALLAAIGAAIRDNSVHNEGMTILVGGVITGALAGLVGCCVPATNKDSNICLQLAAGVVNSALGVAALLTAPLMGEQCLHLGTDWGTTLVDELIGSSTLAAGALGGVAAVGAVACCTYGTAGFFSKTSSMLSKAQAAPVEAALDQASMAGV